MAMDSHNGSDQKKEKNYLASQGASMGEGLLKEGWTAMVA